jgi:hypothetical protein
LTEKNGSFFKDIDKMPIFHAKWGNMSIAAQPMVYVALLSTEFSTGFVDIIGRDCSAPIAEHRQACGARSGGRSSAQRRLLSDRHG